MSAWPGRRPVRTGRAGAASRTGRRRNGRTTTRGRRRACGSAPSVSRSASDGNCAISAARCRPGRGVSGRADEVGHPLGQPAGCVRRGLSHGLRSEKARAATRFAVPSRSSSAPGANTMRWPTVAAAISDPPSRQRAELLVGAVATTTMSRGQSVAPEAVTARTHRPWRQRPEPAAVVSRAAEADEFDRAAVRDGRRARSHRRCWWALRQEQGRAPRGRTADKRHRHDQLEEQQQAQQRSFSTGGRCRSGHCSPAPLSPACRRWTRAPSFRRRCRSPNATHRSSS